jgi:hypothetical protein
VNASWVYGPEQRKVTSSLRDGTVYLSGRSHGDFYEIELKSIPDVWIEEAGGAALVTMSASGVFHRSVGSGSRRNVRDEGFDEFSIPFDTRALAECYAAELRGEIAQAPRTQEPGKPPAEQAHAPAAAGDENAEGWSRWEAIPDTRQNCVEYQVRPVAARADGIGVYEYRFRNVCDAQVILRCNIVDFDRTIRRDLTVELGPKATPPEAAGRIEASGPPAFERLESETRENPVYSPPRARPAP